MTLKERIEKQLLEIYIDDMKQLNKSLQSCCTYKQKKKTLFKIKIRKMSFKGLIIANRNI